MTPTLEQLARELCADMNERGEVRGDTICVRKKHEDEQHKFVLQSRVIPFH